MIEISQKLHYIFLAISVVCFLFGNIIIFIKPNYNRHIRNIFYIVISSGILAIAFKWGG